MVNNLQKSVTCYKTYGRIKSVCYICVKCINKSYEKEIILTMRVRVELWLLKQKNSFHQPIIVTVRLGVSYFFCSVFQNERLIVLYPYSQNLWTGDHTLLFQLNLFTFSCYSISKIESKKVYIHQFYLKLRRPFQFKDLEFGSLKVKQTIPPQRYEIKN